MKSSNKDQLLTFELDKDTGELEIHTNNEGLKILKEKIEFLLNSKHNEHTHLMSEEWGGKEITTKKQSKNNDLIKIVKMFKWY